MHGNLSAGDVPTDASGADDAARPGRFNPYIDPEQIDIEEAIRIQKDLEDEGVLIHSSAEW